MQSPRLCLPTSLFLQHQLFLGNPRFLCVFVRFLLFMLLHLNVWCFFSRALTGWCRFFCCSSFKLLECFQRTVRKGCALSEGEQRKCEQEHSAKQNFRSNKFRCNFCRIMANNITLEPRQHRRFDDACINIPFLWALLFRCAFPSPLFWVHFSPPFNWTALVNLVCVDSKSFLRTQYCRHLNGFPLVSYAWKTSWLTIYWTENDHIA